MALNGTPREETDRYLQDNFELADRDQLLDEVYGRSVISQLLNRGLGERRGPSRLLPKERLPADGNVCSVH